MKIIKFVAVVLVITAFSSKAFGETPAGDSLIKTITAGSTLSHAKDVYNVKNLLKNDESSWAEGAADFGSGVEIVITFKKKVSIQEFYIKNGYGDYKHYKANNRVKMLTIHYDGRYGIALLDDNPGYQKLTFEAPVTTDALTLRIRDVYAGEKYNDTCLTHITFNTWDSLKHLENNASVLRFYRGQILDTYEQVIVKRYNYNASKRYADHGYDEIERKTAICMLPRSDGAIIFITQLSLSELGLSDFEGTGTTYFGYIWKRFQLYGFWGRNA